LGIAKKVRCRPCLSPFLRPTSSRWPEVEGRSQLEALGRKVDHRSVCCHTYPLRGGNLTLPLFHPSPPEPQGSRKKAASAGPHHTFQGGCLLQRALAGEELEARLWEEDNQLHKPAREKPCWPGKEGKRGIVISPLGSTWTLLLCSAAPSHKDTIHLLEQEKQPITVPLALPSAHISRQAEVCTQI
jgi:hypothetical protein